MSQVEKPIRGHNVIETDFRGKKWTPSLGSPALREVPESPEFNQILVEAKSLRNVMMISVDRSRRHNIWFPFVDTNTGVHGFRHIDHDKVLIYTSNPYSCKLTRDYYYHRVAGKLPHTEVEIFTGATSSYRIEAWSNGDNNFAEVRDYALNSSTAITNIMQFIAEIPDSGLSE